MTKSRQFGPILGRDLTPSPRPRIEPSRNSKHVLIIGGGVTGLMTAWTLLDHGYRVTILSKEWATFAEKQRLSSQIAGALWEFPPAVCGQHTDKISLTNSKRWCMQSYHLWNDIASNPALSAASGVRMKPSAFFFPYSLEDDIEQFDKMEEIKAAGVIGFERGSQIMHKHRVDPAHGGVDAYEFLSPVIDSDQCMYWLMNLVRVKGAIMVTEKLHDDLLNIEEELRNRFSADVIVNCTGIAGALLAGDESCYPIRGGLLRVINDGTDFPKLDAALSISADAHEHNEIVFLVPRNDNILLIGGIAESHNHTLDLTLETPIIKRMRARCEAFLPDLKRARLDPSYPLAQGLRPFRAQNVRVERELRTKSPGLPPSRIVHSYGHGGAGWSLSYGCASDVLGLVKEALQGRAPRPMGIDEKIVSPEVQFRAHL